MNMWKVLVVEDDAHMRKRLVNNIGQSHQLKVVGSASTAEEAWQWLSSNDVQLDVFLVDLGLPDGSGLDLIRLAQDKQPQCDCLVISIFGDDDTVISSIEAGAVGYIHKDSQPVNMAQTIIDVKNGASPISPMIARRILNRYLSLKSEAKGLTKTSPSGNEHDVRLTPKEQEALEMISRGYSYEEIAQIQSVSVHTISSHIKALYAKLAVHSRSEAVYEAMRIGLLRNIN